jgi:hypothetical protein
MGSKVREISGLLFIVLLFFISGNRLSGQEKVIISGGIGFPEVLNIGIRYKIFDQARIGIGIGWWPPSKSGLIGWGNIISASGDFYYHFGDMSAYSNMAPWYIRLGLNYLRIGWDSGADNTANSYLRLGKDFFLSEDSGFSLDAGFLLHLNYVDETWGRWWFPALGISLFYRFG